jgi:hypothetical protein
MRGHTSRIGLLYAMAAVLMACSSTPTPQAPSSAKTSAKKTSAKQTKANKKTKKKTKKNTKVATLDIDKSNLPAGVISVDFKSRRANTRVPVKPAALNLEDVPLVVLPKPLKREKAPKTLPPSRGDSALEVEKIDSGWRARGTHGDAVYVVLGEKLGRLQIGTIADDRNASERVYRTCGERYYNRPMLTPARWQTLTVNDDGEVEYKIVDAWFDAKSCKASVVRETVVKPKPVLGTLLFAFRATCEECLPKETINFLAPPLGQVSANGVGGKASTSQGSFTLVRLPLRRGGAASFTGQVQSQALTRWVEALGGKNMGKSDVVMGAEIQHAVADTAPIAITYATLVRH